MTRNHVSRRSVLYGAVASTGLLMPEMASAQVAELLQMLGLKKKDGTGEKSPKALNILKMIALIVALERRADGQGLPKTALAFNGETPLPTSDTSLYQAAMPRLVSLVDRSESIDPALADEAGSVLADLNESQRVPPTDASASAASGEPIEGPPAPAPDIAKLSSARDFATLKGEYANLFAAMQVRPEFSDTLSFHVSAAKRFRSRYESVGKELNIPWYFIAAIHGLEASYNFRAHLHNGDFPLSQRTRQVPRGRPLVWNPPYTWEASAKDALTLLGFANQTDWSLEHTLFRLEAYNGFGYRKRGVATPYVWSYSNHYDRGKFVADGRWNPNARSQQCGAGVVIKALADSGEIGLG